MTAQKAATQRPSRLFLLGVKSGFHIFVVFHGEARRGRGEGGGVRNRQTKIRRKEKRDENEDKE